MDNEISACRQSVHEKLQVTYGAINVKRYTTGQFWHQVRCELIAVLLLSILPGALLASSLLFENFEDGILDSRITASRVGTFNSLPGIKNVTVFGSAKAYGFGRSTCGVNCFLNYTSTLTITLPSKPFVTTISFKEMELYDNWGSLGELFADGVLSPQGVWEITRQRSES